MSVNDLLGSTPSDIPTSDPVTPVERIVIIVSLLVLLVVYFAILIVICFNFWRIMIKLNKIKLIPLTIFYVSASIIVAARICCFSGFIEFYSSKVD